MRPERPSDSNNGFTLLEMVVVLAVIGVLTAVIGPAAFTYIRDAQRTQAQNDVKQIADAISRFVEDTALLPYKNNTAATKVSAKQAGDFDCLYAAQGSGPSTASDATAGDTWTSGGGVQCQAGSATRDTLENHLITNTPGGSTTKAYPTAGRTAWRGPYVSAIPVDPWGNAYLVNVGKGDPAAAPRQAVWVISAGANGQLETSAAAASSALVTAGGDDLIARVQ